MTDFSIDQEFSNLLPPLTEDERLGLEADVSANGVREPLVVWKETKILLDGHNRAAICARLGVVPPVVERSFADRDAARNWMIDTQFARRNLSSKQASYLRGRRYLAQKKDPAWTLKQNAPPAQSEQAEPDTASKIAKTAEVSRATVVRDAEYAAAVDRIAAGDAERKAALLRGGAGLSRAQVVRGAKKGARSAMDVSGFSGTSRRRPSQAVIELSARTRAARKASAAARTSSISLETLRGLLRGRPDGAASIDQIADAFGVDAVAAPLVLVKTLAEAAGLHVVFDDAAGVEALRLAPTTEQVRP
jgi:hypothetical protein